MNQIGSFAATPEALRQAVGTEAFVTDWVEMTQTRIDLFAKATEDYQWLHVDPQRAARESSYGGTIAHGMLTLSLTGKFYAEYVTLPFCEMSINYGLNKVRFINPVRAGSRVRGRFLLSQLDDIAGGLQLSFTITMEIEGQERPACVAESVIRQYYPAAAPARSEVQT